MKPESQARCTALTQQGVLWQTIIHCVFILSAIGIALVDKLSNDSIEGAKQQAGH